MIAHVDCNSFYCSCERVFQPRLRKLPVVVLSNNDGCVIARTQEAKDLAIPMGAPEFLWREFFQKNQVQVFSSNYALYGDMSWRVMHFLGHHAARVEVYSIDEAFLDLEAMPANRLEAHARGIRADVLQCTRIPVGIHTAGEFARAPRRIIRQQFGVVEQFGKGKLPLAYLVALGPCLSVDRSESQPATPIRKRFKVPAVR